MSITDELREYADKLNESAARKSEHGFSFVPMRLECIADSIDMQHERALTEQFDSLTVDMKPMTDENMAEGGWMKLPMDADGKVIRICDKLTCDYHDDKTFTVLGFGAPNGHGDGEQGVFTYEGAEYCWFNADCLHHVERPTVEDTLRKLVHEVTPDVEWEDELFADYADRIREAVKHEEGE